MAEVLNDWLLVFAVAIGTWNALNMIGRIAYGAPWWPYLYSILIGAWAGLIIYLK